MGMYDYVNFQCKCPRCGEVVYGFQSKDRDCQLETLDITQVFEFYSNCESCGAFVIFRRPPKYATKENPPAFYTEEQAKEMGFVVEVEP